MIECYANCFQLPASALMLWLHHMQRSEDDGPQQCHLQQPSKSVQWSYFKLHTVQSIMHVLRTRRRNAVLSCLSPCMHMGCHWHMLRGQPGCSYFAEMPNFGCAAQRKDELLLSEHFSEGLRRVRRALPGAPLRVINFDWHGAVKELRDKGAVEGLWALLETLLCQVCSFGVLRAWTEGLGLLPPLQMML